MEIGKRIFKIPKDKSLDKSLISGKFIELVVSDDPSIITIDRS